MTPWLVLPVKSLADGKSRLAPHLAPDARRALNTRLLERSLALATGFAGTHRTLVVSHCEEVLARASAAGAYALREPHPGLNEGLSHACELLGRREGERLIVLACDLPLATAEDLASLAAQDGVVLATDRAGTGTNALSLPCGLAFQFRYGVNSRQLHTEEADRLSLHCQTVQRPGLAFDLDTAQDWRDWVEACGPQPWALQGLMNLA